MATDLTVTINTLKKIGVVSGEGTPENGDVLDAKKVFISRVDALRQMEVAWWSPDEVPAYVEDALADYLTLYIAPLFMTEAEALSYSSRSERGLADLRRMSAKKSRGAPVKAVYY